MSISLDLAIPLPKPAAQNATARFADKALQAAAVSWFVLAVLGQLVMVAYIVGFYGRTALGGHFEVWHKVLTHGYVAGDGVGNGVLISHLTFATLIVLGGAAQLFTGLRRRFPVFHRWNGRVYLLSAAVMSLGGIFMIALRGPFGAPSQMIAIGVNGLLILLCAVLSLRYALARRFDLHRRWALRLFLCVSGSWLFRVGLMFWLLVNRGPVGFDPQTFQGPAITALSFGQYLLPLFVLELYGRAKSQAAAGPRIAMSAGLFALTLMMGVGIVAASMMIWLPRL